jgi:hypothetical protein
MRTEHHLRTAHDARNSSAQDSEFSAANVSAELADIDAGANPESQELEQLRQSLAAISAGDRHTLLKYFRRVARYIAAIKSNPAGFD